MKSEESHEEFWNVVVDCLVMFHRRERKRASNETRAYRVRLEGRVDKSTFGLIYHEEPFVIACEIAAEPLDISKYAQKYEIILNGRKW